MSRESLSKEEFQELVDEIKKALLEEDGEFGTFLASDVDTLILSIREHDGIFADKARSIFARIIDLRDYLKSKGE